ncbi:efflux transporter outer membrane subunit [Leptothrix ochracea]|uniref:efflux transporter outer membrane subunit n=1 Tax=Leptothrix ochracea TaxID=735331 RepID=UPI0034E1DFCB
MKKALGSSWIAALTAVTLAGLAGCTHLAPSYERPAVPSTVVMPAEPAASSASANTTSAPLAWDALIRSPQLRPLVQQALANNRDVRVALLSVERARAQLGVVQADRYPTLGAGLSATRSPSLVTGKEVTLINAGVQFNAWELDFFGRIANLSEAAKAQLLATEAGRRSAELTLVAAVVTSYLNLAANIEQLAMAERALSSRSDTLKLTQLKADVGAATQLELVSAQSLVAQAQSAVAQLSRARAQELNNLSVLVGGPVPTDALPPVPSPERMDAAADAANATTDATDVGGLAEVPGGLSSEALLARPDVVQAEQALIAAHANIGAARAAFFPRITLTASAGQVANVFSDLLQPGHFAWTLSSQALMTIFDAGRNQSNLEIAKINREIAVAQYEKAVQNAFRDTADALAAQASWRDQRSAQELQLRATREIARLTDLRASRGAASELERQDAQRNLLAAEQALVQTRLAEQLNRLTLWKAMGGG